MTDHPDDTDFKAFEAAGWTENADSYEHGLGLGLCLGRRAATARVRAAGGRTTVVTKR